MMNQRHMKWARRFPRRSARPRMRTPSALVGCQNFEPAPDETSPQPVGRGGSNELARLGSALQAPLWPAAPRRWWSAAPRRWWPSPRCLWPWGWALMLLWLSGCQLLGGVQVEPLAVSTQLPSQVAVYVSVKDRDESLVALEPQHFKIYEDGTALPSEQVGLTLLSRDLVAEHHVLILVDLSGPIEQQGAKALLASQLAPLVERLRTQQSVSLYGYDGSSQLYPIASFEKLDMANPNAAVTAAQLSKLTEFKQQDPSSNLNGAVITALNQLTATLVQSKKPLQLGSLLVLARSPDLAGRTGADKLDDKLFETPHEVFAVTFGETDHDALAQSIGRSGHAHARLFENMEGALNDIAAQLEANYNRYYLLAYCSPARAGTRALMIEVNAPEPDGGTRTGEAHLEFSADGFTSGCDSSARPLFANRSQSAPATSSQAGAQRPQPASEAQPSDSAETESAPTADDAPDDVAPILPPGGSGDDVAEPPPGSNYAR